MNKPKDELSKLANEIEAMICDWNSPRHLAVSMEATCEKLAKWHTSELNKLFNLIESEVIGEDDKDVRGTTQNPDNPIYHTRRTKHNNELRATQRTQLQLIKERIK